ncbi:MAG: hypothetical protein ACE5H3_08670 [Planctomycetota bacterium]
MTGRGRSGMGRWRGLAWLVLLLGTACTREEPPAFLSPSPGTFVAWVGNDGRGLEVIAEPLASDRGAGSLTEDRFLHKVLGIDPDRPLLRLHLLGEAGELGSPGRVTGPEGDLFEPVPEKRTGESPRARLFRLGVARGGPWPDPSPAGRPHRSFLLAGRKNRLPPAAEPLLWERDGVTLQLEARAWTGRARQDFLEGALEADAGRKGRTDVNAEADSERRKKEE